MVNFRLNDNFLKKIFFSSEDKKMLLLHFYLHYIIILVMLLYIPFQANAMTTFNLLLCVVLLVPGSRSRGLPGWEKNTQQGSLTDQAANLWETKTQVKKKW